MWNTLSNLYGHTSSSINRDTLLCIMWSRIKWPINFIKNLQVDFIFHFHNVKTEYSIFLWVRAEPVEKSPSWFSSPLWDNAYHTFAIFSSFVKTFMSVLGIQKSFSTLEFYFNRINFLFATGAACFRNSVKGEG